ncbi:MAG: ATP-binding protein [Gemmatimonadota bacterium]
MDVLPEPAERTELSIDLEAVLRHASVLQQATTLRELIDLTLEAVRSVTRYRTAWLAVQEPEDLEHLRIVQVDGPMSDLVLETCPRIAVAGDAMLAAVLQGGAPVVVMDASTDPRTNKVIVSALGNQTIINVPLAMGTVVVGALGVGTFGAEGILPPTADELQALVVLGTQLAGAIGRMRLLERQRQDAANRLTLERQLESLQRVELMGVLAAGVAHDLNTYLTVVLANLGGLDGSLQGEDAEAVGDALHATRRAAGVVKQLLSLGRAQSRREDRVDLNARVTSTLRLVRSSIPTDVTLVHEVGASPVIEGDPVQIEQALANLLINARDAVGRSGRISVQVGELELTDDFVALNRWARAGRFGHVQVHDSGRGIDPDILPRIFDPLFSTKHAGTGLGLAVVSRVVQQHDGLIHCESSRDGGTTFDLFLPMRR